MAVLDPRDDSVVIRVVYDGAPMAGKTTSVGALGQCFGAEVHSPADLAGRTLYFDWLEYTGGWFDGHQIRCQVVSVPGQITLASRRHRLLDSADVVVFVAGTLQSTIATDATYLRELQDVLRSRSGAPVGIVLQANKRDLPTAVPLAELQALLERIGLHVAIVESVAAEGVGVRESFVLAVRLALDRVRELMSAGELPVLPPAVDSAADLMHQLEQGEATTAAAAEVEVAHPSASPSSLGSVALREAMDEGDQPCATVVTSCGAGPLPPDVRVATGLVWPPVDGRIVLHEISASPPELLPRPQGGWSGVAGRWHCYTLSATGFATLEQGRDALVEWARVHSQCHAMLSKDRCIALVADVGCFRLWQVIRTQATLRAHLEAALQEPAEILASQLLKVMRSFHGMATTLSAMPYELQLSIDCIAASEVAACHIGVLPEPAQLRLAREWSMIDASEALLDELQDYRAALHERRIEVLAALAQHVRADGPLHRNEWVLLQRLLLKADIPFDSQRRSA